MHILSLLLLPLDKVLDWVVTCVLYSLKNLACQISEYILRYCTLVCSCLRYFKFSAQRTQHNGTKKIVAKNCFMWQILFHVLVSWNTCHNMRHCYSLQEKSLKFHARMFMASSAHVTKEIYTCLGELYTSR